MNGKIRSRYDREADAIYIRLTDREYARGRDLDDHRRVDYDADGNPRGIELLFVSHGVNLDDLPFPEVIASELAKVKVRDFA